MDSWIETEIAADIFNDKRLDKRFKSICTAIASASGQTIPQICQDWSGTKAFYRFLDNEKVSENKILQGHTESTEDRMRAVADPESYLLVLHDTTEFTYKRTNSEEFGEIRKASFAGQKSRNRAPTEFKVAGVMMHCSLATTDEGLPLGVLAAKMWTRKDFKNTDAMKKKINPTRVPIEQKESIKWIENLRYSTTGQIDNSKIIHIGDRENDIFEFFSECNKLGTNFIVRTCVNRKTSLSTIDQQISERKQFFVHKITYQDKNGNKIETSLKIKYVNAEVKPPHGKQKKYETQFLTYIIAEEIGIPEDRDPICWKILTNLDVANKNDTIKIIERYKKRWLIEIFFKILKSGLKTEALKLRTVPRIKNMIAICIIVAWRIHWLTMMTRITKNKDPRLAFNEAEIRILKGCARKTKTLSLQECLITIAKLGGYLNRNSDPPPGIIVIWRGFHELGKMVKYSRIFVGN